MQLGQARGGAARPARARRRPRAAAGSPARSTPGRERRRDLPDSRGCAPPPRPGPRGCAGRRDATAGGSRARRAPTRARQPRPARAAPATPRSSKAVPSRRFTRAISSADLRRARGRLAAGLDRSRRHFSARELREQPRRAVRRAPHALGIDAALEAIRGLAADAVASRRAPHAAPAGSARSRSARRVCRRRPRSRARPSRPPARSRARRRRSRGRAGRARASRRRASRASRRRARGARAPRRPAGVARSKACSGWPSSSSTRLRDVDDDAAAAHARGLELALEPGRATVRRAHAAHDARDVVRGRPRGASIVTRDGVGAPARPLRRLRSRAAAGCRRRGRAPRARCRAPRRRRRGSA